MMMGLRTPPHAQRGPSQNNASTWGYSNEQNYSSRRYTNDNNFDNFSEERYNHQDFSATMPPPAMPPPPQQRAYMSALASMYGDYESNLARKRKMQEEFAESLRRQIEEKKSRTMQEKSKNYPNYSSNQKQSISYQASQLLEEMQLRKSQPPQFSTFSHAPESLSDDEVSHSSVSKQARTVSFAPVIELSPHADFSSLSRQEHKSYSVPVDRFVSFRNQFSNEETMHHQEQHMRTLSISTESPFARQKVGTPPLGFSIRHSQPVKTALAAPNTGPQKRVLPQTKARTSLAKPKPTFISNPYPVSQGFNNDYFDDSGFNAKMETIPTPEYPGPPDGEDVWTLKRLDTETELVYPDGHISQR